MNTTYARSLARRARGGGYLAVAFALAAFAYGGILAADGIYPFGDRSLLMYDMANQYAVFHSYYHQVLTGHAGLGFTWRADLGLNFLPLFAYYLASPFSLLVAFIPDARIPEAMALIAMLKIGAGSAAMAALLRRTAAGGRTLACAFAVPYALSAWAVAYAFNIMWLDALYLLPLMLIAGEALIRRGRLLPLAAACAAAAFINYYMFGIMLPFVVLYLYSRYAGSVPAVRWRDSARFFVRLAIPVGVGIAAAGILLVPSYYGIEYGRSTAFAQNPGPLPVPWTAAAARMFGGTLDPRLGSPNLAGGTVALMVASLFPFARRIPRAERIALAALAALLVLASQNQILWLFWQDGEQPNGWPFRYGFLVPALLVLLAYRVVAEYEPGDLPAAVRRSALAWLGVLLIAMWFQPALLRPGIAAAAAAAIVAGAAAVSAVAVSGVVAPRRAARSVAVLAVVVVLDGTASAALESGQMPYAGEARWTEQPSVDWGTAMRSTAPPPGQFFRADGLWSDFYVRSQNDSLRYGNFALSHFSSLSSGRLHEALAGLGFTEYVYQTWAIHTGATLLTDALFSYRYLTTVGPLNRADTRLVRSWPTANVYENTATLPPGFLAPATLPAEIGGEDPFRIQEQIFGMPGAFAAPCDATPAAGGALIDTTDPAALAVTRLSSAKRVTLTWHCHASGQQELYAWAGRSAGVMYPRNGLLSLQVDSGRPTRYLTTFDNTVKDLGTTSQADFTVTLTTAMRTFSVPRFFVRALDVAQVNARVAELAGTGLNDVVASDSGLSGTIDAPRAGWLFLAVPAIRGWGDVLVDGRGVAPTTAASAFLSVPVTAGHHSIVLRFRPPGLRLGSALSGLGLALLAALWWWDRRRGARWTDPAAQPGTPLPRCEVPDLVLTASGA